MGIGDLLNRDKKEVAIKKINDKSETVIIAMNEYYSKPGFNMAKRWEDDLIIPYIKGDLLRTYLHLCEVKDKEAKTFFKDGWFDQHAYNSIVKIYELARQIDSNCKRHPEIAQGAQDTIDKIYDYAINFFDYQRLK